MATLTPRCIGREFVRQYYTMLHKDPTQLHRFYMKHSLFTHGSLLNETPIEPIIGQEAIHTKIMQRDYRGCHSKIISVDSQQTINGGVVVQVAGELTIRGMPKRTFTQTFVLEAEAPKKYYVYNDIFRYQDEEAEVEEQAEENPADFYSADEEELKDEPVTPEYDQTMSKVEDLLDDKTDDHTENVYHQADQDSTAGLTNGGMLAEDEESNGENEAAYNPEQDVAEAQQPQTEEVQESDASNFEDAPCEEEKHEEAAAEPAEEEVVLKEPAEPEGPPKPVTWAAFVKKNTPTTPPHHSAPASRPAAAKVSPQPAVVPTRPPPRRREELPRRDNRADDGRRKFVGAAPDTHQIFIGNLPSNITEADIKDIFKEYGTIVEIRLNAKNFGFVAFDTPEPAERILKREKPIVFGKSTINVEEKRASGSGARGGPRREFGAKVRNDSGSRGNVPGGRAGPPMGNRDRPRGGPGGQQKPRGGMNGGGEGRGENSRGPRSRERGAPVGSKR